MLLLYRGENFDPNFYYHSGVDIDHSFLLSSGKKRILLTSKMNESLARSSFRGKVLVYTDAFELIKKLAGRKKVSADMLSLSARMAKRLGKVCHLKDASMELLSERARKKPEEVSCIRKAVRHTREVFDSLDFKKAKTELDLKKQILLATLEKGLEQAFEPIVATDRNSSFPHYRASNKKLGSLVLVDYGVKYEHYCSDLTRCFILGRDKRKESEYERLQDVCNSIVDALPELKKGKDVAKFAGKAIARQKFSEMIHSIGHGVGLEIHENPRLGAKSDDKIAGTVLAIEPAFYFPNKYGMRYEETVWFDGKRARIL